MDWIKDDEAPDDVMCESHEQGTSPPITNVLCESVESRIDEKADIPRAKANEETEPNEVMNM